MPRLRRRFVPSVGNLEGRTLLTITPIGAQVLAYAQAHVNKQVGDGECATLAVNAVASGGGVSYSRLGPVGLNANYVWGSLVTTLTPGNANTSAIRPGDILQYNNVHLTDTMTVTKNDGSWTKSISTETDLHHTSIVSAIDSNTSLKNDLEILESNVLTSPSPKVVQGGRAWGGNSTYVLHYTGFTITVTHTMTSGTISVYRPYKIT
jgi:hypothetical protein